MDTLVSFVDMVFLAEAGETMKTEIRIVFKRKDYEYSRILWLQIAFSKPSKIIETADSIVTADRCQPKKGIEFPELFREDCLFFHRLNDHHVGLQSIRAVLKEGYRQFVHALDAFPPCHVIC